MEQEEKKNKKGLFKVTRVKLAAAATTILVAAAALFGTDNPVKDYILGDSDKNLEKNIGDGNEENKQPEQTPTTDPEPTTTPTTNPVKDDAEPTPEDDDYYFDEEDPEDLDEAKLDDIKDGTASIDILANDDFADLVIPNINAYKGKGNSIVDALKLCGYPSDFESRARLADFFGIPNYKGFDFQNLQLLEYLYQYYAYLENGQDTNANTNTNLDANTNTDNNSNTNPDNNTTNPDDKTETDKKHTCKFGEWKSYDDEKERRTCSCGKYQERNHKYGPWLDLGNGKEARICNNCGHVHERDKHQEQECDHTLGAWEAIDDTYEVRRCSCGQEEEKQLHPYGPWIDNGDGTCSRVCPNCKHKHTMNHHIDTWIYENDEYEVGYCKESGCLVRRPHPLGEPTVTYKDNGDGTHTKTITYHCSSCDHDIVKTEVLNHGNGTWEAIDDDYERLVDECGHELARGEHPFNVTVNDDGSKDFSCPNCGRTKHQDAPEHTCSFSEIGRRYSHNNEQDGICYTPILGCECGITKDGTPVKHNWHDEELDGEIKHECTNGTGDERCGAVYYEEMDLLSLYSDFDHEVSDDDDFDYEVSDDDDFDLQEEDIPETAFLNLSRKDIRYMADMAIARIDLEDALNEEMEAKGLNLKYKG